MAKNKQRHEPVQESKVPLHVDLKGGLDISELEGAVTDMEKQLTEYAKAEAQARELRTQATGALGVLRQLLEKAGVKKETNAN